MIATYKYRIKDGSCRAHLLRLATACNQVWNFCCATQRRTEDRWKAGAPPARWKGDFDLIKLTAGVAADLGLHSDTVSQVCRRFSASRNKIKHAPRFRVSFGSKRSLGWVPMIPRAFKLDDGRITYKKRTFHFWNSRPLPDDANVLTGDFVEDARGRWYLTLTFETADVPATTSTASVGIDLGLATLATLSDGRKIDAQRTTRGYAKALATAQRAGNKRRARAISAKIANVRQDFLHRVTTQLVKDYGVIRVGDVSSTKLAKTKMAKSVLDSGWGTLRSQLAYKSSRAQVDYAVVPERYTSQMCSCCGVIPRSSPKGMGALGIRHWQCSDCGTSHDRDVNAARNILAVGREHPPLVEEIPAL